MGKPLENVVAGVIEGTGADLALALGFIPYRFEYECPDMNAKAFWEEDMADDSAYIDTPYSAARMLTKGGLGIGTSADTAVKLLVAIAYELAGVRYTKASAEVAFTATTHDITQDKWGVFKVEIGTDGTLHLTPSAALNYDTEALAIAALPATTASHVAIGYVTVKATSGAIFNATTDALAGGTSGTPAEETNYYLYDVGQLVTTNGIKPKGDAVGDTYRGVEIGANTSINVDGLNIRYRAYR